MTNLILALIAGLALVNVLVVRPNWWIGIVIISVVGTFPAQVPERIYIGGFGVALSEIALAGSALYVAARYEPSRLTDICAAVIFSVTTFFAFVGYLGAHPVNQIANDVRGLLAMSVALFVAGRIAQTSLALTALKSLRLVLWLSFAIVTLASFGSMQISGRVSDASLDNAESGVTRIQSATTHTAAAVLAICVTLWILKASSTRTLAWYFVPALGITILGFSRNALVILGLTVVVALLLERRFRTCMRAVIAIGGLAAFFMATGWLLSQLSDLPGFKYVHQIFSAYSERVVGGFSADVQATDSSTVYRELEAHNMRAAITGHELFGHGMGYAYQPVRDKKTPTSSYYGHQFYLWATVKTGYAGVIAYLLAFAAPILRAVRQPGMPIRSACAACAVSLLYVSTVAPLPLSSNGGPLIGALMGAAAGLCSQRTRDSKSSSSHLSEQTPPFSEGIKPDPQFAHLIAPIEDIHQLPATSRATSGIATARNSSLSTLE
ncbi:UNVERIFIED_ORG: O-antigen ligase [Nocardia globerula]|uniref:O-antigen ligase n=1 Tax=Nocardia globerula TaxID=1818 RepID=A0A652YVH1_NOCGL|nr:O-antigen ligase family protein [Rhodococcus globerulus]NMD59899.1 hypothetical protein [Nocardia globerula]PVX63987.1 O-antigen ligase [Rhodococcus globerulus]